MPNDQEHDDFAGLFTAGAESTFAIRWISGVESARVDFKAYAASYSISHAKDDKVQLTVELSITGPVTYDLIPV
jgi:hypothetical protein